MKAVRISCWLPWSLGRKAVGAVARFWPVFGITPELVSGGGGAFDVDVEDERVGSRHVRGDCPGEAALIEHLRGRGDRRTPLAGLPGFPGRGCRGFGPAIGFGTNVRVPGRER